MEIKEYQKKYREEHKEEQKEYMKQYYQKNRDKFLEKAKKYRDNNRDKFHQHQKRYREDNKEKNKEKIHTRSLARIITIPKGQLCVMCKEFLATEKHHKNYDKPLEVMFVCKDCHIKLDKEVK